VPVDRRDFLRLCLGSAAALGLPLFVVGKIEEVLTADGPLPTVVWLNGANRIGCTISLANRISLDAPTDVADLLLNFVDLAFTRT
jgi:Ni,Fe-hydrogenase I small subunit